MKRTLLVICAAAMLVPAAFADEAPPTKRATPVRSNVQIFLDSEVKEAKLVIARETLDELYATDGAVGSATGLGTSRTGTIFGGLLISASFMLGGIWLARKRSGGSAAVSAASVIGILAAGSVLVMANAAPVVFRKIDSSLFSEQLRSEKETRSEILIEVSDDGLADGIKLLVPLHKDDKPKNRK